MMILPRPKTAMLLLLSVVSVSSFVTTATPISGSVNITGSAAVSATAVDFYGNPAFGCSIAGVGVDGCYLVNVPLSGAFVGLTPGTVGGTIKDLQGPPISGLISLPSFMTFTNGVVFDLYRVIPGGAPDCATVNGSLPDVSCTPIVGGQVSPFVLTNSANATNASVFFNIEAYGYTGSSATGKTVFVGAFNTPSAGKNIAGILSDIGEGKSVAAAYSANFVGSETPVPEPDTRTLLGLGVAALLLGAIRRRPTQSN